MKKNADSFFESGFKIPDTYFDTFETRLKEMQQLEALNPLKDDGFRTPQGYFEALDTRLQNPKNSGKVLTLWPLDRRVISAALAMAAAILILLFLWNPEPGPANFDNISAAALNDYFEEEGIQDFITDEDLSKIEDNATIFQSFSMNEELFYYFIDDQVLEDELEPLYPND